MPYITFISQNLTVIVQSLSYVQLFATQWTGVHQASLSFTLFWSLIKCDHCVGDTCSHLILCHSFALSSEKDFLVLQVILSSLGALGKASACNAGDPDLILGLGRSPGEENAIYSNILAWRIPWTEEPGGLESTGSQSWTRLK